MNRLFAVVISITAAVSVLLAAGASYGDPRLKTPRVAYVEPKDGAVVDLSGKPVLTFKWSPVPMPAGGREAFRFKIYKGFSYEVVFSQDVDHRTFSTDVPADKFTSGQTYTWRVQQRDASSMIWGLYDTWSFQVNKR